MMAENMLYYGDNLDILRRYVPNESVDLIYLDPPFKSNQDYNVLFSEQDGTRSSAQIKAFEDTWIWDQSAAGAYEQVVEEGGHISLAMQAFRTFLGDNDMLAYLSMMAPRLVELRRVLKPTGSIYLHCDPTASHYLKMLLDAVFGPENFRNEIIWQRSPPKGLATRRLPQNHDVIFHYQKGKHSIWNMEAVFIPYNLIQLDKKTASKYRHRDSDGRLYRLASLINPNPDRPNLTYEFLGKTKVWRWTKKRLLAAYNAGLVVQTRPGTIPQFKRYLDQQRGRPFGDIWTDIPPINSQAAEDLGYPTQKPEALLERIIKACSNEGDTILDPFCGCGTAVSCAQRLKRRWIGIDITHIATGLIKSRLRDAYGDHIKETYNVIGEPTVLSEAKALAKDDPYQFQWWALGLVGARHVGQRKGADKGIDGRLFFHDRKGRKTHQIILSVKSGHLNPDDIRSLLGVVNRDQAAIGVLMTLQPPTRPMKADAASAGFYQAVEWNQQRFPRIQILTIAELLAGKEINYPKALNVTFKVAPKGKYIEPENQQLAL
jgi:DNA modification methylase